MKKKDNYELLIFSEDPLASFNTTGGTESPRILVTAPTNQDLLADRRILLQGGGPAGTASTSVASIVESPMGGATSPTPFLQEQQRSPTPLASHTISIVSSIASRSGPLGRRQERQQRLLQSQQPQHHDKLQSNQHHQAAEISQNGAYHPIDSPTNTAESPRSVASSSSASSFSVGPASIEPPLRHLDTPIEWSPPRPLASSSPKPEAEVHRPPSYEQVMLEDSLRGGSTVSLQLNPKEVMEV